MRIVLPPLGGHEGGSSQPSQGGGAAMRIVFPPGGDTRGAHPNLPKGEGLPCGMFAY